MESAPKIDIVLPVYNEGDNIARTIAEIDRDIKTPHRILVVYDFDEDNTLPPLREIMREKKNIMPVKNIFGRGALGAIKTGFKTASSGIVIVVMADLSDDLAKVDSMVLLADKGYDIVCPSRYMPGGAQLGGPPLKGFLSRWGGITLRKIAGVPTHDPTNSFKLYTKRVLDAIEIESDGGFELGIEIVVKAHFMGFKIAEVPATWRDRTAGESRFKLLKWLPKYMRWYFYAMKKRFFG